MFLPVAAAVWGGYVQVASGEGAAGGRPCKAAARPAFDCAATVSVSFDKIGRAWRAWSDQGLVLLQHSADKGKSWSPPIQVNREPEAVLAHTESRPKVKIGPEGNIYVTWARGLGPRFTAHILFSRSTDGGKTFSAPAIVHGNVDVIGHRFDDLAVAPDGTLFIAWLDSRDTVQAKEDGRPYNGSALYYTWSESGGSVFHGDRKIADGTSQCCRIQTAFDRDGLPVVMWRHIFGDNIHDHALVKFADWGVPGALSRVNDQNWKIDACPHHGPGLAIDGKNRYHAVWFHGAADNPCLFYGYSDDQGRSFTSAQRFGAASATRPHIAALGSEVAITWLEFDGRNNRVMAMLSRQRGERFAVPITVAEAEGMLDNPFVVSDGKALHLSWQTQKNGYRLLPLR